MGRPSAGPRPGQPCQPRGAGRRGGLSGGVAGLQAPPSVGPSGHVCVLLGSPSCSRPKLLALAPVHAFFPASRVCVLCRTDQKAGKYRLEICFTPLPVTETWGQSSPALSHRSLCLAAVGFTFLALPSALPSLMCTRSARPELRGSRGVTYRGRGHPGLYRVTPEDLLWRPV